MVDILLVEDNEELSNLICSFLKRNGYSIQQVMTGDKAIDFFQSDCAKLVLLDIMLPDTDGFAACSQLRKDNSVPIIIMSAKVDKEDKMNGFMLGADDYLEKPVDVDLLRAKIGALMRRNYDLRTKNTILHSGAVSIVKDAKEVYFYEK